MRLHSAQVPEMAKSMVKLLIQDTAIEAEFPAEVQADVEAVLNQYIRDEHQITEKAKDLLAARNLPTTEFGRMKRLVADQKKFKLGDDGIDYILDQLIEMLMHSQHVDEVYVEDWELRRRMRTPLRQAQAAEEQLQQEVRGHLKHVKEGSALWEVEYRRMMDDIKRRKGL